MTRPTAAESGTPAPGEVGREALHVHDWRTMPGGVEGCLHCPATQEIPDLRRVTSDGEQVVQLRCPGCQRWGAIDDDQLHGRVSVDHSDAPGCSYHETRDWASTGTWSR